MILFFYGEDTYRLSEKIKALKEKFVSASLGDTNLAVLDGQKAPYSEIGRQILAMPFLANSRLVIINNLFAAKKEVLGSMIELLPRVPKTTVLVITHEGLPDRRTALFKALNKPKLAQEFKALEPYELERWVRKELEVRNTKYEEKAIEKLIEYVGSDLWRMTSELDKLTAYGLQTTENSSVVGSRLSVSDIELLVTPQIQTNIFALMDAVSAKDIRRATSELTALLEEGKAEIYLLSMIALQFKNLLIIKDMVENFHQTNSFALAKQAGLHPFVVKKSLILAKKYSFAELKNAYRLIGDYDSAIKTGKIEARVGLEVLIYKLTAQTLKK